jgi:hypothetical protein
MNLFEVAKEIANRLTRTFLQDKSGRRPVYGGNRLGDYLLDLKRRVTPLDPTINFTFKSAA